MHISLQQRRRDALKQSVEVSHIIIVEVSIVRCIIADPEILGGKPIVEDTRLSVEHILGLLAHGMSHAEIVAAYPELTIEDVKAVVQYAAEALQNDVLIAIKPTRGAE